MIVFQKCRLPGGKVFGALPCRLTACSAVSIPPCTNLPALSPSVLNSHSSAVFVDNTHGFAYTVFKETRISGDEKKAAARPESRKLTALIFLTAVSVSCEAAG